MEYCESDLEHVIRDRSRLLSAGDIKAYMQAGSGRAPAAATACCRAGAACCLLGGEHGRPRPRACESKRQGTP